MKKVLYLLSIGVITLLTLSGCSKDDKIDPRFFLGEYVGNCSIEYYDSEGERLRSLDEEGVDCSVRISENVNISNELLIYLEITGPERNRIVKMSCVTDDFDCGTTVEKEDYCHLKSGHSLIVKESSFDDTRFPDSELQISKKDGVFKLRLYLGSKKSTQIRVRANK